MNRFMFLLEDHYQENYCQMGHTLVHAIDVEKHFRVGGPCIMEPRLACVHCLCQADLQTEGSDFQGCVPGRESQLNHLYCFYRCTDALNDPT